MAWRWFCFSQNYCLAVVGRIKYFSVYSFLSNRGRNTKMLKFSNNKKYFHSGRNISKNRSYSDICFFSVTVYKQKIFSTMVVMFENTGRSAILCFSAQRSANKKYFLQRSNLANSGRAGLVPVPYDKCWLWFFFSLIAPNG